MAKLSLSTMRECQRKDGNDNSLLMLTVIGDYWRSKHQKKSFFYSDTKLILITAIYNNSLYLTSDYNIVEHLCYASHLRI